jgi:glycosyltransferase involved in cell wall biosynthesis
MASSVSVIVPTRNSARTLAACLASIRGQSEEVGEIIVCDSGSDDATPDLAADGGAIVVQHPPNRSGQRNRGVEVATGEYLLFIDSDMRLGRSVVADCLATMQPSDAALVIPEIFVGDGFWAAVRGHERTFYEGVWWIEAARWYRAAQFRSIGGFATDIVGMEDWDLDQRIRQLGDVRHIKAIIEHDEGRAEFRNLVGKKAHYSSSTVEFATRHPERAALALSPLRRAGLFAAHPLRLARHPILTGGVIALGLSEIAAARGWGASRSAGNPERPISYGQTR